MALDAFRSHTLGRLAHRAAGELIRGTWECFLEARLVIVPSGRCARKYSGRKSSTSPWLIPIAEIKKVAEL
jgi:hypothetical protein